MIGSTIFYLAHEGTNHQVWIWRAVILAREINANPYGSPTVNEGKLQH